MGVRSSTRACMADADHGGSAGRALQALQVLHWTTAWRLHEGRRETLPLSHVSLEA